MSRRKNEAFTQLVVGLFMIAVIALLGYFTIVISGADILAGRSRAKLSIVFDQVGGLKDHDNVMYRGTKVGTVERVCVTPTNLLVIADVDENVVLRQGYRVSVCNLSMLGGNYLQLEEGDGERLDVASVQLRGETPTDWMQDVSRIAKTMNELVNRPEVRDIISNVTFVSAKSRAIADRVDAVMARIERGEGFVGRMLANDNRLYSDLETVVSNVNDVVARVNRGEGFAGKMLSQDDRLFEDVRQSVASFKKACESFDMGETKGDVKALAEKGNRLIENLNVVAERLRNGEGTLGKLVHEPGMYNEVEGLIKDCRQVIDNYRDTTPIATFTSILTGAL